MKKVLSGKTEKPASISALVAVFLVAGIALMIAPLPDFDAGMFNLQLALGGALLIASVGISTL